jgi:hypothetical protein
MDPADVRKVMLEEAQGGLGAGDPRVVAVRHNLFGGWEGNWLPLNSAADIDLPGAAGPRLPFLMYPQVEVAGVRLDCVSPESAGYSIHTREVV